MRTLLTDVIISIVADKLKKDNSFGLSIINLPDIDFQGFLSEMPHNKLLELYFLGYDEQSKRILQQLPRAEEYKCFYSVEEAEESRNLGSEDIFRIHFIKNTELEKLSSLRWYDKISMEQVYKNSCKLALDKLPQTNNAIRNFLQVLGRKDIRALLNFERVLDYLEALIAANEMQLPIVVNSELYRLGLLVDDGFLSLIHI